MSRLRVAKIGCQPWIRIGVAKDVRMHAEPGGGADVAAKTSPPPPSSLSISRLKTMFALRPCAA
jgi:hypothetical protein